MLNFLLLLDTEGIPWHLGRPQGKDIEEKRKKKEILSSRFSRIETVLYQFTYPY